MDTKEIRDAILVLLGILAVAAVIGMGYAKLGIAPRAGVLPWDPGITAN